MHTARSCCAHLIIDVALVLAVLLNELQHLLHVLLPALAGNGLEEVGANGISLMAADEPFHNVPVGPLQGVGHDLQGVLDGVLV
jgi:hypothetical protein